jgi:hypothetical protein
MGGTDMEQQEQGAPFRIWVCPARRVVSFHAEEGFDLLEFQSREMYLRCVDGYIGQSYRYQ